MKEAKLANKQHPLVVVANYSGGIGKTAITNNLLVPRMPGVKVFGIETVNSGYEGKKAYSGDEARAVLTQVLVAMQTGPVIIDVGASNADRFFDELAKLKPILSKVTAFLVPTIPQPRVITDTLNTIQDIIEKLDVPAEKIFVVFNKVPSKIKVEEAFAGLLKTAKSLKFNCIEQTIDLDETFVDANKMKKTIDEIANDIDYLEALSTVGPELLEHYSEMSIMQINARDLQRKMDAIFDKLGA